MAEHRKELDVMAQNVIVLDIIIGLMAENYPVGMIRKFLDECAGLEQKELLLHKASAGLKWIESNISAQLYDRICGLFGDQGKDEPESQAKRSGSGSGTGSQAKRNGSSSGRSGSAQKRSAPRKTAAPGAADGK